MKYNTENSINSLYVEELEELLLENGEKKFRARQLFEFFHKNGNVDLEKNTVFSNQLKEKLSNFKINKMIIWKKFESKIDKTKKYLFKLEDGFLIESVYMEYDNRSTICISTQVGCRIGCVFCASTKKNFKRNLEASELLQQIYLIENDLNKKINNIVLMGIGEPLDNYDNVVRFLKLIHDKSGHGLSYRSITISTCGIVDKIYKFSEENIPINFTISLHNPFNEERKKIMPIANKFSINQIIDACFNYFEKTGRRISFEYTLVEGINDGINEINEIVRLFKNKNIHINLIPLNEIKEYDNKKPSNEKIKFFMKKLKMNNINATIRKPMGEDISGACGQLRATFDDSIEE